MYKSIPIWNISTVFYGSNDTGRLYLFQTGRAGTQYGERQGVFHAVCVVGFLRGMLWGRLRIEELLRQMKDFEKETEFFSFYHKNKGFYDSYLNKAREVAEAHPYVTLLENEYGKTQGTYRLVISSLMKGNFGIVFEEKETKQSHLYAVLSTHGFSLSPNILFHEFSHPFINPLTEKYGGIDRRRMERYNNR